MENRFGIKDFTIVALLLAVIVMVSLCMAQYDRQWEVINQANNQLRDQTRDLASIRRLLEQGGVPTAGTKTGDDLKAGFERILKTHSNPDYAPGDSIVDTMMSVPGTLTPLVSQDSGANEVQSYVQQTLCGRDPNTFKWTPLLAKSWHVSDDQLTIDFELRRGITFSNGDPLTADDVVFTMDMQRNEQIEAPRIRAYLDKLDRVEKTGEFGVRFVFKEPYFKSFEVAALTRVLSRKFYSQFSPKDFNESTGLLFGSGPYRLADPKAWRPEPGKPIELIRNERYWGVAPAADRMIWKVIANASARVTAFGNGETDSYSPTPEQYDAMCAEPALASRTMHFALDVPIAPYRYLAWSEVIDGKPTRFADKRVRQAMTMLIDRQAIVKDILRGYASVNSSCFSSLSPQADPTVQPLPYDPAKAVQLLTEAGYKKQNGTLVGPDGVPFEFKISYNSTNSVLTQIASYIKDSMARAGIIVDPAPTEFSVLIKQMKDKKIEVALAGWTSTLEVDPHQIFSTDSIAGTGDNFVSYSNKELDKLVEQARSTVKDDDRMQLWHRVHQLIHEDQPYTFLYIAKSLYFVDSRFKGVMPTKIGINPPTEWYVPTARQKYKQ